MEGIEPPGSDSRDYLVTFHHYPCYQLYCSNQVHRSLAALNLPPLSDLSQLEHHISDNLNSFVMVKVANHNLHISWFNPFSYSRPGATGTILVVVPAFQHGERGLLPLSLYTDPLYLTYELV